VIWFKRRVVRDLHQSFRWIDTIYVNQRDIEERNQQLLRMSAIYRIAEITVAWLGDANYNTFLAFDTLRRILEGSMDDPGILSLTDKKSYYAIIDLIEREYWRHIWITQEIALSQNVLILCGSHSIPWSSFELAFKTVNEDTDPGDFFRAFKRESFHHMSKLQQFRGDATADTPVHFFMLSIGPGRLWHLTYGTRSLRF
jgi:hypothetical protein